MQKRHNLSRLKIPMDPQPQMKNNPYQSFFFENLIYLLTFIFQDIKMIRVKLTFDNQCHCQLSNYQVKINFNLNNSEK
jgi:hypothetical protein